MSQEEITKDILKYLEISENENAIYQKFIGCSKGSVQREKYSCKCLH